MDFGKFQQLFSKQSIVKQLTRTNSGRITVRLDSSLTRLDLTKKENMLSFVRSDWIKTSKTGEQPYSNTSPQW